MAERTFQGFTKRTPFHASSYPFGRGRHAIDAHESARMPRVTGSHAESLTHAIVSPHEPMVNDDLVELTCVIETVVCERLSPLRRFGISKQAPSAMLIRCTRKSFRWTF